jgi:hypothetical protein
MSAATTTTTGSSEVNFTTRLVAEGSSLFSTLQEGAVPVPQTVEENHSRSTSDNPEWWPTQHRRVPDYRRARFHPQWNSLTDSMREAFMIDMMFRGCYLLSVSCAGRHNRFCMLTALGYGLDPSIFGIRH